MPVIDPHGLLEGARLAACSDMAQLYWPRLFCAANGYGRLELHFATIKARCFGHMEKGPTEDEFLAIIEQYHSNCLALVYPGGSNWWMQFATESKYLRRWKTAEDERSPAPSAQLQEEFAARYAAWKEAQARQNRTDTRISEKLSQNFGTTSAELRKDFGSTSVALPLGVGIGGGLRKSVAGLRKSEEGVSPAQAQAHSPDGEIAPPLFPGTKKTPPPTKGETPEDFVRYWNAHRGKLPAVKLPLSAPRRRKVNLRIKNGLMLETFAKGIAKIHATPFLLGDNDRGWSVKFNFLIKNDDVVNDILAGDYDRAEKPKPVRIFMTDNDEAQR
jgi:hypothetical protein